MAAALSLQLTSLGLAQAASTAPATSPAPAMGTTTAASTDQMTQGEEPVKLSPFVVDASKDLGYHATSTLAGTRVNTDIKDLAGPISVVTRDLLNDIDATSISDVLAYQVGAEGTRDFSATGINLGRSLDNPSQDPNASTRARGLTPFDVTRDYFFSLAVNGWSSLSTGTSVGFDPYNFDTVTISRGPNSVLAGLGSSAGIINFSPQTASFGRNMDELTLRWGSYGDKRATFNSNFIAKDNVLAFRVAGEWTDKGFRQQPSYAHDRRLYLATTYKPTSKTTISASVESVKVHQELPNTFTPEDDVSQWIAVGKPSSQRPGVATGLGTNYLYTGMATSEPTTLYNPDGSVYKSYNTSGQYAFSQGNDSNVGLWQAIRFGNGQFGDWEKLNTSPSNSHNNLNTETLTIDQELLPGLVLNLAYLHEKLNSDQLNLFRPDYIQYGVDVNQELPNGAPNPYYGETYMYFRGLDNKQDTIATNRVERATLTYNLDLKKYNKWYGRYNLTGFMEQRRTESDFIDYNAESSNQPAGGENPANPAYLSETGVLYYMGGTAANGYRTQTVPGAPQLVTNQPYLNADGSIGSLSSADYLKEESKALTKLSTSALVAQAFLFDDMVVPMIGIRRDTDEAGFAGSNSANATIPGTGGLIGPAPGTYGPLTKIAVATKTYGVVVHPLKWLNLFYQHSQNFIPNAGSIDLEGNPTPHPAGVSKDYGISVDLFEGKLNAKVDWYQTFALNGAAPSVNFPLVQWSIPFMQVGEYGSCPMQDLLNQAIAAGMVPAGTKLQTGLDPSIITGDPRLANAYTADNQAKGIEFELTYNVTKNWRIFGTVSKDQAEQSNIASALTSYINARVKYWQSTPGLWTGLTTKQDWSGQPETGQQVFNNDVLGPFISYQSADGQPSTQLHKWKASLVQTYTFTEGAMKGFSVGTGLRWMDRTVIGNPAIYSLVNGTETVTGLDLAHPYTTPPRIGIDAWVGYTMKVHGDKYRLSFQLNIRDLGEKGGYRPIAANSDGTHAVFQIVQPMTFYFTTKFDF